MRRNNPTLLITDDDQQLREALDEVFRPRGFRTLQATDGTEAIDIVQHEPIDVVLLDVHMPRLTGVETLVRLRQLQFTLPCILLTAKPEEPAVREVQIAYSVPVVRKPFSMREILRVVFRTLQEAYDWEIGQ